MRNTRLIDKIKVVNANIPTATGTTLASTVVDANGYGRCMFVLTTGAAATGATLNMKITQSDVSGGTYDDITNAALVEIADTGGAKKYVIDVPIDGTHPFLKTSLAAATDTFACSCAAYLYRGHAYPIATTWATQAVIL